ncbi:4-hydroxyphenylacetate 3-hydroxylase N-terminal domain-containing protein, partial [Mycobacterium kansasii]
MTTTESAPRNGIDTSATNPAENAPANSVRNFASRPMTGDEYIESLRDDREIWLHGERVKDVTTHPAFRNPVRMTARLYDSMHT